MMMIMMVRAIMILMIVLTWDYAMKKGEVLDYLMAATSQNHCSWLTPALPAGLSQVSSAHSPAAATFK